MICFLSIFLKVESEDCNMLCAYVGNCILDEINPLNTCHRRHIWWCWRKSGGQTRGLWTCSFPAFETQGLVHFAPCAWVHRRSWELTAAGSRRGFPGSTKSQQFGFSQNFWQNGTRTTWNLEWDRSMLCKCFRLSPLCHTMITSKHIYESRECEARVLECR